MVLPFLLTAGMVLFDRLSRRLGRAVLPSGVVPREVLLLAAVSIVSHPILDTLNTYGVRWLMPFRGNWSYGDTLFIMDPWLWLVLGIGVVGSRAGPRGMRGHKSAATHPARMALAAAGVYVVGMALMALAARGIARRELNALGGPPVDHLMVGPLPITPFVRQVVAEQADSYRVGSFQWLGRPHVEQESLRAFPRPHPDDPALLAARAEPLGRRFLGWARFPTVQVEARPGGGSLVHLIDLRYADRADAGFGTVTVPVRTQLRASVPASDPPASSPPAGPAPPAR
jgi:inner membrane protein